MDKGEQMGFVDSSAWPFWAAIIAAGIVSAILGLLLGIPALRLSGPYLAIATLALMISFPVVVRKYDEFTQGTQGVRIQQPEPPGLLDGTLDRDQWLYFVALFLAAAMLLAAWAVLRGPLGRAFVAVRESEVAAAAMGINVARTKVTAFTISAFYAGIAGGLFTQVTGNVSPESIGIEQSINYLTAIVTGGLASMLGSVIGAALLEYLPELAEQVEGVPGLPAALSTLGAIRGAIVIFVILVMPYGIAGFLRRLSQVRAASALDSLRGLPSALRARARGLREDLAWSWESRPWNRESETRREPRTRERP